MAFSAMDRLIFVGLNRLVPMALEIAAPLRLTNRTLKTSPAGP
jgi:hypothetical protein